MVVGSFSLKDIRERATLLTAYSRKSPSMEVFVVKMRRGIICGMALDYSWFWVVWDDIWEGVWRVREGYSILCKISTMWANQTRRGVWC